MAKHRIKKYSSCPFCGGDIYKKYTGLRDRFDTTKQTFSVWDCKECGVGLINPMPVGDVSSFYPANYLSGEGQEEAAQKKIDFESWYRNNQYHYDFKLMTRATGLRLGDAKSYVDIGSGSGERVTFAREQGCKNSYGVDKFDFAKNKSKKEDKLINSEVLDYKPAKKFEVVSMFHVLEHVENPHEILSHINDKILAKNGYLVVQVPNYDSFEKKIFRNNWFSFDVPRHIWQYNEKVLSKLLADTGYKVEGVYKTNAPLHPVTVVPSIHRELDIQRIWVSRGHGAVYRKTMTLLWAGLTVLAIPFTLIQNAFKASSMLTVVATKKS